MQGRAKDTRRRRPWSDWRAWVGAALLLPIGAVAVWSALWDQGHVREARAVIDQVYGTPPRSLSPGGARVFFDQYGLVHFRAQGRTTHARALLASGCVGVCDPAYHAGQELTVFYDPQNPSYAQAGRPGPPIGTGLLAMLFILGVFGLFFLMAAMADSVARYKQGLSSRFKQGFSLGRVGSLPRASSALCRMPASSSLRSRPRRSLPGAQGAVASAPPGRTPR